MLTISGKALGRKKPLFADWAIPLPPDLSGGRPVRLRYLLDRLVRAEVAAFQTRQKEQQTLHVLSARQIELGAERGKIASGGSEVGPQKVDPDEAVAVALQAFEDGLYLVVVDGDEKKGLDDTLTLREDSAVAFVRLVMLAGG